MSVRDLDFSGMFIGTALKEISVIGTALTMSAFVPRSVHASDLSPDWVGDTAFLALEQRCLYP